MTGLGTFLVGLMPTYETIGIWAPILLVTIRLVQGFGVGGEQGGAVLLTCETAPAERRGFYGSLVQLGAPAGFLLPAGLFALLTSTMSEATFIAWGWRIPFLLSAVVIGVGLWVRLKVSESPAFEEARHRQGEQSRPMRDLLTSQRRRTLLGVGAKFIESSLFPLATTFVVAYAASQDVEESVVLNAVLVAVAVELLAIPLWGRLTDRVGRRPVFLFGAAVHLVMIVPLFLAVRSGSGLWIQLALLVALPIAHAATYAPQASFFPELFPTRVRYSGMSVVWQFGALVASGPFTVVAAALLAAMGGAFWGVALYVAVLALVSVACLLALPGDGARPPRRAISRTGARSPSRPGAPGASCARRPRFRCGRRISDARVIVCCPGRNFVTLKITTDDGVTGVGDATLNGRELAVAATSATTSARC